MTIRRVLQGRRTKAAFVLAAGALALAAPPGPAVAQTAGQAQSAQPVPGDLELAKLVWWTMLAVDQANQSGNYSVLRDISATGFQINNDAARLAQIFAGLRASGVDLSNTLLLAPTYAAPPAIVAPGTLRVRGYFGLRPTAIQFDFTYQWIGGRWRPFGLSISPRSIAAEQPGVPVRPAPAPLTPRRRR